MPRFSDRTGRRPTDIPITIRDDAPTNFRMAMIDIAYEAGHDPIGVRSIICRELREAEDPANWSPFPNVDGEVRNLVSRCEWWEVYDIVEAIHESLVWYRNHPCGKEVQPQLFEEELNKLFHRRGIGWKLQAGLVEVRGGEEFESAMAEVPSVLQEADRPTAANEIHEAIRDLSRRPNADITGAIQHGIAALECVARDVTGDPKATLGQIMSRHPELIPPPLNQSIEKIWGFASERGRHLSEGRVPAHDEAELVVLVSASLARYLSSKYPRTLRGQQTTMLDDGSE